MFSVKAQRSRANLKSGDNAKKLSQQITLMDGQNQVLRRIAPSFPKNGLTAARDPDILL